MGQTLATISVYSLQKYYSEVYGKDLFQDLTLPDTLDRDAIISNILLESMQFEAVYTDPAFLQGAIGVWSKKHAWTFNKWAEALQLEYDPISNYDRREEWYDDGTKNTGSKVDTKTDTSGEGYNFYDNTTDHKVAAYDSDQLHQDEQTTDENATKTTDSTSSTGSTTGSEDEKTTNKRTGRAWGNIGVTTSQQMLLSELNEAAVWNITQHITDLFLQEFCIMVY